MSTTENSYQSGQRVDGVYVSRRQMEFLDESTGRVYVTDDDECFPSVTTISGMDPLKDLLRDKDALYSDDDGTEINEWAGVPDEVMDVLLTVHDDKSMWHDLVREVRRKEKFLSMWKGKHTGGDSGEHWSEIRDHKADIGTIAHAETMEALIEQSIEECGACESREDACEDHSTIAGINLWGEEETASEASLEDRGEFCGVSAPDHAREAVEYVVHHVVDLLGEQIEELLTVETYAMNRDLGYAGQIDIVYRHTNGSIVACDLKTGKSIYHSYKMQLEAYSRGLDYDIDRLQVVRVNPLKEVEDDDGEIVFRPRSVDAATNGNKQAHIDLSWDEDRDTLYTHFRSLCDLFYHLKFGGRPEPGRNLTDDRLETAMRKALHNPIHSPSLVESLIDEQCLMDGDIPLTSLERDLARDYIDQYREHGEI